MYWVDTQTGVDVEPARKPVASAVRKFFTEGGAGVPVSVPGGDWYNQITNELLNVLAAAGIDPSKTDDDQLLQAIYVLSKDMGAWEALRRSYSEAGLTVKGPFIVSGVVTSATDVLIDEATWKGYSHGGPYPHTVEAGETPAAAGWTDRSDALLRTLLAAAGSAVSIGGKPAGELGQITSHYFEQYGAVGDGVFDNTAAFAAAKAVLGTSKACRLSEGKTYFFAGSRPDLSGLALYAERGAKIKTDANPNIKTMTLLNDITINNTVHATTLVKHGNASHDYLVAAGAAVNRAAAVTKITKKLFGDADVTLASFSAINTKGAFTGTNNGAYLSWAADFVANHQGAFLPFEEAVLFEAAFRHIGSASLNTASNRTVCVSCGATQRVDLAVYPQGTTAKLIVQGAGATQIDIPLPNGGAYSLAADGSITLGARVVDGVAEFYINGTLIKKFTLAASATEIAFLTSYLNATKCQILIPTKSYCAAPNNSTPKKLAVVGDSISYGAWASESYDTILAAALEHCGVGNITSVNYSVSGSSTADWKAGGSIDITTKNVSDCHYTLIMLGTNDVQGGVTGTTYEANMRAIIANVIAQGSRPVLGVFPVWTQTSISGVIGVDTQNYEKGGWHRQIVKMLAAEFGLPLADVCAKFGTNISWYGDNIHPTEHGLIAVAGAFAEAILCDANPAAHVAAATVPTITTAPLTLQNSWVAIAGQQVPTIWKNESGQVMVYGPITSGSPGSTFATVQVPYRPSFKRSFKVHASDATNPNGYARLDVNPDGTMVVSQLSFTPVGAYSIYLDGTTYVI